MHVALIKRWPLRESVALGLLLVIIMDLVQQTDAVPLVLGVKY